LINRGEISFLQIPLICRHGYTYHSANTKHNEGIKDQAKYPKYFFLILLDNRYNSQSKPHQSQQGRNTGKGISNPSIDLGHSKAAGYPKNRDNITANDKSGKERNN